jgi:hypothetical protein
VRRRTVPKLPTFDIASAGHGGLVTHAPQRPSPLQSGRSQVILQAVRAESQFRNLVDCTGCVGRQADALLEEVLGWNSVLALLELSGVGPRSTGEEINGP